MEPQIVADRKMDGCGTNVKLPVVEPKTAVTVCGDSFSSTGTGDLKEQVKIRPWFFNPFASSATSRNYIIGLSSAKVPWKVP